ncbi:MAG TPA: DinB family protein [Cyclobacteriaceae bacterium]|nr:DinB family protein [Cyclobacteriaceae bacterium]
MRFLIIIFVFAFLQSMAQEQAPLIKEFLQKWNNSKEYTLELLNAYPEDKLDFKPTDSVMSFREQVMHIIVGIVWHSGTYLQEKQFSSSFDRNKNYTKAELIRIMDDAFVFSTEIVNNLTQDDLEKRVDFFAGNFTKRQILNLMDDHVTHHRGELVVYLRLNNIKPPAYRGW